MAVEITVKCVGCGFEMTVKGIAPPEVCQSCMAPVYVVSASTEAPRG